MCPRLLTPRSLHLWVQQDEPRTAREFSSCCHVKGDRKVVRKVDSGHVLRATVNPDRATAGPGGPSTGRGLGRRVLASFSLTAEVWKQHEHAPASRDVLLPLLLRQAHSPPALTDQGPSAPLPGCHLLLRAGGPFASPDLFSKTFFAFISSYVVLFMFRSLD